MGNNGNILYIKILFIVEEKQHYIEKEISNILLDYIVSLVNLLLDQQYKKIIYKRYLYQCNPVYIKILKLLMIVVFQQNI